MLALFLLSTDVEAGFLLQSARHFDQEYFLWPSEILLEDVTGDGITDVVLANPSFHGIDGPIITTYPGMGDGTLGEPILTNFTGEGGEVNGAALVKVNNDQHLDLVLNTYFTMGDANTVLVFLGNGDGTFTLGDQIVLGHNSFRIVAADFTGDGNIDFAVNYNTSSSPWGIHLYQGAGDGTFSDFGTTSLTGRTDVIITGDFDDDGDTDMVTNPWSDSFIILLRNNGSGQFTIHQYNADTTVVDLAAGDLNGDGYDDLAACNSPSGNIGVYFGNADGTLSPYVPYDSGDQSTDIALGDLDNDGDLDLTVNTQQEDLPWGDRVAVMLNDGDGQFSEPAYFFRKGYDIALDDMDGDGALDAVMNGPTNFNTSILLGMGNGEFHSMTDLILDDSITDVSCADVDLDGDQDLVVATADYYVKAVQVLLNNGDGTFADPATYDNGQQPQRIDLGDLNGDGYPEIIISSYDDDSISILMNAGDGTFQVHQSFTLEYNPTEVKAGDLDGDGDIDLAVCYSGTLGVLINPGTGVFSGVVTYASVYFQIELALGDVDGDGDLDAAIVSDYSPNEGVHLMINNGEGVFAAPELLVYLHSPEGLALADLDGDSDLDLAVGKYVEGNIRVMLNDGSGTFTDAPAEAPRCEHVKHIQTGDLNSDGQIDLVAATGYDVTFFPGFGDGTFGPAEQYPLGNNAETLDLADLDGNGSLDVAVCLPSHDANLSVFFNSLSGVGLLATGPGRGEFNPTLVRIFPASSSGNHSAQWSAYGVDRWGVNVALGELTGAGLPEVLTGAGPGAVFGPHVRGFDISGTPLPGVSYFAYGTNKYGVNVACGDLDNDGYDEIVTGAGPGAVFGPHVRGWNWDGTGVPQPIPGISYFAYGTPKWGVNVSCGDIDGDGYDEIVTGAGPGAVYGPHVRGWNCDGGGAQSIPGISFLAYGTNKYGVNVACGDIDGDGIDEIVTGAGPGVVFGPHVRGWNWDGSGSTQAIPAVSFFAYSGYTQWGVNVSCGDLDDDGIDEILTGPGPGPDYPARVRGFNYDGQVLTAMTGVDFIAYDQAAVTHGVKVAGNRQ